MVQSSKYAVQNSLEYRELQEAIKTKSDQSAKVKSQLQDIFYESRLIEKREMDAALLFQSTQQKVSQQQLLQVCLTNQNHIQNEKERAKLQNKLTKLEISSKNLQEQIIILQQELDKRKNNRIGSPPQQLSHSFGSDYVKAAQQSDQDVIADLKKQI